MAGGWQSPAGGLGVVRILNLNPLQMVRNGVFHVRSGEDRKERGTFNTACGFRTASPLLGCFHVNNNFTNCSSEPKFRS